MKKLIAHYSFPRLKVGGVTLKKVIQLNYLFYVIKTAFEHLAMVAYSFLLFPKPFVTVLGNEVINDVPDETWNDGKNVKQFPCPL